jgi:crotonobetainyl-CoA:carnitine CoA-transferase CaiB-like acyl-CoA transferase
VKLGLPAGPILTLDQVFGDPHVSQTGLVEEIEHPRLGRLRVIANPIRMAALAGRSVRTPPPALGEHSRQVLRDFGLDEPRIDALQSAKVILDAR